MATYKNKGFNDKNTDFLFKAIRQAVRRIDADILFLQDILVVQY